MGYFILFVFAASVTGAWLLGRESGKAERDRLRAAGATKTPAALPSEDR